MTYGKLLSDELRDSITKKFSDIKFDGITKFYPLPENLVLPYNHNSVSFDFIAIETGRNFLVRYQYILEGYDNDWNPITEKTSATFGNISEGTYTFKLKARSPEGVWSEPIEYKFTVLPPWYRHWIAYTSYSLLLASFILFLVWWNGRKLRERAKQLTEKVRIATAEIREQKEYIEEQKKIVEEHQKDIIDSIHYAQRIQRALFASDRYLKKHLPEHFVLFKPKDIVSGDFYWANSLIPLSGGRGTFLLAVCDCTGHGVPGAFMSLLNISLLNEAHIAKKINQPYLILNEVRDGIIKALNPEGMDTEGKDGMDCILMNFDFTKNILEVACANNSLWIVRDKNIIKIKADKMPVGLYSGEKKNFTLQKVELQEGDIVYAFTDGYADQFGGHKGKKFKYKLLEEKLLEICAQPMEEQKQFLEKIIDEWRGILEQVDDILVIGIKI